MEGLSNIGLDRLPCVKVARDVGTECKHKHCMAVLRATEGF
jgi:hypothetical protein